LRCDLQTARSSGSKYRYRLKQAESVVPEKIEITYGTPLTAAVAGTQPKTVIEDTARL
jgi:hypothetical protein